MADILEFRIGNKSERDRPAGPGEVVPMSHVDLDVVLRMVAMLRRMDNPAYLDDFNRCTDGGEQAASAGTNQSAAL